LKNIRGRCEPMRCDRTGSLLCRSPDCRCGPPGVTGPSSGRSPGWRSSSFALGGGFGPRRLSSPERASRRTKRLLPQRRRPRLRWDEALTIATDRLRRSRETDPNQLAFFTGRDQSRSARDCTALPPFVECADG
jgi:hypothetical protein